MVTARKTTANRLNAARSTGPRTPAGKGRAKLNAVAHGLRSVSPVLPGEDAAEWESFRAAVLDDLAPAGVLEGELAHRVALLLWRLRRATTLEVAAAASPPYSDAPAPMRVGPHDPSQLRDRETTLIVRERQLAESHRLVPLLGRAAAGADGERFAAGDALFLLEQAADAAFDATPRALPSYEELLNRAGVPAGGRAPYLDELLSGVEASYPADVRDPAFLAALGVPADRHGEPERWAGWTAGVVRAGLARLVADVGWSLGRLLKKLGDFDFAALEDAVRQARAAAAPLRAVALGRTALPPDAVLDPLLRYEPHLSRELARALDQLEKARALRR